MASGNDVCPSCGIPILNERKYCSNACQRAYEIWENQQYAAAQDSEDNVPFEHRTCGKSFSVMSCGDGGLREGFALASELEGVGVDLDDPVIIESSSDPERVASLHA